MTTNASARSEQSTQPPVNLASLPRDEALERARAAGRDILGDAEAVQAVADALWMNWVNVTTPVAIEQTDAEFGDLVDAMGDEFFKGLTGGVSQFASNARTLKRVENFLVDESSRGWRIYNVLAFMAEALPDDTTESLPTRCTVVELREDMKNLAADLMDLVWRARHE
ncbi:hypothetical protein [Paraburkholderia sp. D1E]|uniref:hypothetical protein n=1 Tax=Paraburkholderia sp. D1E TaxID=3461398 RepID=UPI00404685BF